MSKDKDENKKDAAAEAEEVKLAPEEIAPKEDGPEVPVEAPEEESVPEDQGSPSSSVAEEESVEPEAVEVEDLPEIPEVEEEEEKPMEAIAPADDEAGPSIPEQSLNQPGEDVSPAAEDAEVPDGLELPEQAPPIKENYLGQPIDRDAEKIEADSPTPEDKDRGLDRPFRSAVKHFTGERVTLGDGVAEALAADPESIKSIYLPILGQEAPASEFVWVSDGKPVNK